MGLVTPRPSCRGERRISNKSRSFRRDGPRQGPRSEERHSRTGQKERWVDNSLSSPQTSTCFPCEGQSRQTAADRQLRLQGEGRGRFCWGGRRAPWYWGFAAEPVGTQLHQRCLEADVPQEKTPESPPYCWRGLL